MTTRIIHRYHPAFESYTMAAETFDQEKGTHRRQMLGYATQYKDGQHKTHFQFWGGMLNETFEATTMKALKEKLVSDLTWPEPGHTFNP